jgi:tetratricopeptide (TPR) repeat protein
MREALDFGERSLAIAREVGAREQIAFTLTDLWRPYIGDGDLERARTTLEASRPMWRELDNPAMLAENLGSACQLSRLLGNDDEAIAFAEEAREISARTGNLWGESYALSSVYPISIERGDLGTAIALMHECIDVAGRAGFIPALAITRADLGWVHAYLGDLETGRELVRQGAEVALERQPISLPWAQTAWAYLHLIAGELDQAEDALDAADLLLMPEPSRTSMWVWASLARARLAAARGDDARAIELVDGVLARLRSLGIHPYLPEALLVRGRSLAALGRTDEARQALVDARAEAETLGHRRALWEVLAALADVVERTGDPDDARGLRAEAERVVLAVADSVDDVRLRALFLDRPGVRAVLTS